MADQELDISHAFINILSASYQGMHAFFNGMGQLSGTDEWAEDLQSVRGALDVIRSWWGDFKEHKALWQESDRQAPSDAFRHAWGLLEAARSHHRWTLEQLARSSSIEALMSDANAVWIRGAASCGAAYGRQHYIQGLINYGEVMDNEQVADRWRQHLLPAQAELNRAHEDLELARRLAQEPAEPTAARLLDGTMTLPAIYGQRVIDIAEVFSYHTGQLTYEDVEVDAEDVDAWKAAGFEPPEAGRWYIVGMLPEDAAVWIKAGVPHPVVAFDFLVRGFSPEEAAVHFAKGVSASDAQARR